MTGTGLWLLFLYLTDNSLEMSICLISFGSLLDPSDGSVWANAMEVHGAPTDAGDRAGEEGAGDGPMTSLSPAFGTGRGTG